MKSKIKFDPLEFHCISEAYDEGYYLEFDSESGLYRLTNEESTSKQYKEIIYNMKSKFKVVGDTVVIVPIKFIEEVASEKESQTDAGIFTNVMGKVDHSILNKWKGKVVASGPGVISGGKRIANVTKVGDIVYYIDKKFTKFTHDGVEYHFIEDFNIMLIENVKADV